MSENRGYFGEFGGRYVAEVLRRPLEELEEAFYQALEGS
jgi:tryptophan synthase beta chain